MTKITRTKALGDFLNNIGSTVFLLNTICVGLDRVKQEKITDYDQNLRISWVSKDPENDSQRARIYANKSSIAFCIDTLEQYLLALNGKNNPRIIKDSILIDQLKKENSIADRFSALINKYKPENKYWAPCVRLLISWRNRIIHTHAKANFSKEDQKILLEYKEEIREKHSGLDIEKTLNRYKEGEGPTLKDTSTMISILIRSIRYIDSKLIELEIGPEYVLDVITLQLKLNNKKPSTELKILWNFKSCKKQKKIYNLIRHHGIISGDTRAITAIPVIQDVIDMDLDSVLNLLRE
jgi:hypothetical protein